jgi:hypothetical protein
MRLFQSLPCLPAWEPEMENIGVVTLNDRGYSAIADVKSMIK